MSVAVTMPQLGESVTEGTVTRWLKKEGERVEADEPLLEVSTDKVDTEIPSPASGILRGIVVDEDETVEVGAQLAMIEDSAAAGAEAPAAASPSDTASQAAPAQPAAPAPAPAATGAAGAAGAAGAPAAAAAAAPPAAAPQAPPAPAAAPAASAAPPAPAQPAGPAQPAPAQPAWTAWSPGPASPADAPQPPAPSYGQPASQPPAPAYGQQPASQPPAYSPPASPPAPAYSPPESWQPQAAEPEQTANGNGATDDYTVTPLPGGDSPYVTPLVRKLASEHGVDLEVITGTGVGGRIRKQDVLEAARAKRAAEAAEAAARATAQSAPAPSAQPPSAQAASAPPAASAPAPAAPAQPRQPIVPSALRGTRQKMSRARQVIAQRMMESLQTSAQLTTVIEVDVTAIARLRDRAKRDFEAREGVKLSFLPFFALAAIEALKIHPTLNAVIDGNEITYHDAEHLGVAVDTERGLMVPVIHNAGDLNIGGLARKIGDLAARTRSGQVSPDELSGGTFTLTNTGSRGALFDTPIINQPQVAILGTGIVVKRPVVVEDAALGEVIAVRSMVYLALTYDHRLVDGADAARYLVTVKNRLEEGAFEAELGL